MNKIRAAGLGTHDIVFLGAGFEDIAIKQGLLAPLDETASPRLPTSTRRLKKTKDDGKLYCATYSFGLDAFVVYDPAKTQKKITSWKDVFSGDYKGQIGKIDKSECADLANRSRARLQIRPAHRRAVPESSRSSWKT